MLLFKQYYTIKNIKFVLLRLIVMVVLELTFNNVEVHKIG